MKSPFFAYLYLFSGTQAIICAENSSWIDVSDIHNTTLIPTEENT